MTPELALSFLLAVVSQLELTTKLKCTLTQIQQMTVVMKADPGMPTEGVFTLVKSICS